MLTSRCNLTCPYCSLRDQLNRQEADRLSTDEWLRIVQRIPRWCAVMLTGGEPFLASEITTILEALLSTGHLVSVVTNGTVLDEKTCRLLVEKRLRYLMVSLDGLMQYHDHLRGLSGAFEKATAVFHHINAIRAELGRAYPLTCVKTTITEDNAEQIPKLLEFADRVLHADHFAASLITNTPLQQSFELAEDLNDGRLWIGNRHQYSAAAQAAISRMEREVRHQAGRLRIHVELAPRLGTGGSVESYLADPARFGVTGCCVPWAEITLHYNGNLSPCIGYRLDNIRNLGYDPTRIRKHPRYRSFLRWYSEQEYLPACQGCCWGKHEPKGPSQE